ncbi:WW domain-containing oxidoreductase-like [Pecten maximus]|uniref:WW domain-containing oxidoreductase-like n=1 Tax=Pecten maximus TaxID=6579 RepID=UPI0014589A5E|nr:WW domain-containing oxidoreductase-like [Pecten maximus]
MGGHQSFPRVTLPKERVVIVTGANTGIGYETAKCIAMMGATVILACRSEEKANQAMTKMNAEFQTEKDRKNERVVDYPELKIEFMKLDCASLQSVMDFVKEFKNSGRQLHVLVCNAGIGMSKQAYTEDGYELMFQVNYLSQYLLSAHLLPIMKTSGEDCRIVLVSSEVHRYSEFNLDRIQGRQFNERNFKRTLFYGNSKAFQIMQMFSMNRRLQKSNVTVVSLHPGVVQTEVTRNFTDLAPWALLFGVSKLLGASKTPFEGAETTINAAVNPALKGVRDVYYNNCKPDSIHSRARNKQNQESLWAYTQDCLKKGDFLPDDIIQCLEGE